MDENNIIDGKPEIPYSVEKPKKRKYVKSGKYSKKKAIASTNIPTEQLNDKPIDTNQNEGGFSFTIDEIPTEDTKEIPSDVKETIQSEQQTKQDDNEKEKDKPPVNYGIMAPMLVSLVIMLVIGITNIWAKKKQPISDAKLSKEEEDYIADLFNRAYGDVEVADPKTMFWLSVIVIAGTKVDYQKFSK